MNHAISGAELAPMLTSLAQAGQQYQAQSKQFDEQKKVQQSKLNEINAVTNKQSATAEMTSPYGTGATPPVAAAGYPLLDPYSNPQYWAQRGQQFKFSMDVASKRSETMNNMAKIQLEQEKKKQEMMMKGIGTLMKTAGSTMGQMAADKKAEELKEKAALEEKAKAVKENARTGENLQQNVTDAQAASDKNTAIIKEYVDKPNLTDSQKIIFETAVKNEPALQNELKTSKDKLQTWKDSNPAPMPTVEDQKTDTKVLGEEEAADGANKLSKDKD
tara:strand:- start:85 stop:906 length:822 start_codon:yes stop_codon:yes gene_type:complete